MKNNNHYYFTSESVSDGHPDKVCDRVAASILDAYIAQDPNAHVAIEALFCGNRIIVGGETRSTATIDVEKVVRQTINEVYSPEYCMYSGDNVDVEIIIQAQSENINDGVMQYTDKEQEDSLGAGDQGTVYGYSVKDTNNNIPLSFDIANKILQELKDIRENEREIMPYILPDAKAQVTVEYDETGTVCGIDNIVVSTSHTRFADTDEEMLARIRKDVRDIVIPRVFDRFEDLKEMKKYLNDCKYHINPAGIFEAKYSGPWADSSTVGRKIVVDNGGSGTVIKNHIVALPVGGGNFNGKDPSKVDMSAAVMARYIANNCVHAGLADAMTIELSYAIGYNHPVSFFVNTFGTSTVELSDAEIAARLQNIFDASPSGNIKSLRLLQPIYKETSSYGWFGRKNKITNKVVGDEEYQVELFPWERLDAVDKIKKEFGI